MKVIRNHSQICKSWIPQFVSYPGAHFILQWYLTIHMVGTGDFVNLILGSQSLNTKYCVSNLYTYVDLCPCIYARESEVRLMYRRKKTCLKTRRKLERVEQNSSYTSKATKHAKYRTEHLGPRLQTQGIKICPSGHLSWGWYSTLLYSRCFGRGQTIWEPEFRIIGWRFRVAS